MKQFSKRHLVALWSVQGIGNRSYRRCLFQQKKARISDEAFWLNAEQVWQKSALTNKQISSIQKFKKEQNFTEYYQQLKTKNIRVLLDREKNYPLLLKSIAQAPPVLFIKARDHISANYWNNLFLAVVGTRRISSYGRYIINTLLRDLLLASQAKLVSGFMYGVDVEAMRLAHEFTQTIGVLGYGFDYCYPRHQRSLMKKMLEEGAVFISEYPPAVQPCAGSFVQRNRIIAGLSQAVMLVEAAAKSGSLITAQCAVDEGRAVLAVPGPISNPYSVACHGLIKEGAHLITSVEDFYQALNLIQPKQVDSIEPMASGQTAKEQAPIQQIAMQQAGLSEQETELLAILRNQGTALSFDQLALSSHCQSGQLAECLLKLQIKQIIEQQGQNYILKI